MAERKGLPATMFKTPVNPAFNDPKTRGWMVGYFWGYIRAYRPLQQAIGTALHSGDLVNISQRRSEPPETRTTSYG